MTIFCFSGTGNSLWVAKELARATDDVVVGIPQVMAAAKDAADSDAVAEANGSRIASSDQSGSRIISAERIGIVYPIYGHDMPTMVAEFVATCSFDTNYLYVIPTFGTTRATAVDLALGRLRAAGHEPAYAATVQMVDNWLPACDMDQQRLLDKDEAGQIARIAADVAAKRRFIEPVTEADSAARVEYLKRAWSFAPQDARGYLGFDAAACTGCETCAAICPGGCIRMEDGVAVRDALANSGCQVCVACIQACPAGAITMGELGEVNPNARYRNPQVSLDELMQLNCRVR